MFSLKAFAAAEGIQEWVAIVILIIALIIIVGYGVFSVMKSINAKKAGVKPKEESTDENNSESDTK